MSDRVGQISAVQEMGSDKHLKRKYLVFDLAEERYAFPLSDVREVIGLVDITSIPQVPTFFKGVINLRGKIISVVDLRLKLGLPSSEYFPKKTSIIITEIHNVIIGFVVDNVEEVASYLMESEIDTFVNIQTDVGREYISGIAKKEASSLVLIMDVEKILTENEFNALRRQA